MPTCKLCDSVAIGRGLCRKHYNAAWRTKDFGDNKPKSEVNTIKDRLLAKITITENGCWEFTGQRKKDQFAYGLIWKGNKAVRAHRVSYEEHIGPIPDGIDVLHKCDNPPCVNPDHLFLGTRGENCTDAASKNRFPLNDKHHNTKLSVEDVKLIKAARGMTNNELARHFKVSQPTISRIRAGLRRQKIDIY